MNLQHIRTPTLKPLRHYTKLTLRGNEIRNQKLIPGLCLYLANNMLETVPSEVYHLENLEVLSLRSNALTEVLPSLGRLTNLRELNLSSNQLRWLPWEILSLRQNSLEKLMIYPNPLIRPLPLIWAHDPCRNSKAYKWSKAASTRIAFLDSTGASLRGYPPAPSSMNEYWPDHQENAKLCQHPPEEGTNAPSLLELALRACYKTLEISQLPFLLPKDCPAHLTQLLKSAWRLKEAGGQTCSVCGEWHIVPRTEWVEWWYYISLKISNHKSPVKVRGPIPLLRRGCSLQCWEETSTVIRGWTSTLGPGADLQSMI